MQITLILSIDTVNMIFYLVSDQESKCLGCIAPLEMEVNGKSSIQSRSQSKFLAQQIFEQLQ